MIYKELSFEKSETIEDFCYHMNIIYDVKNIEDILNDSADFVELGMSAENWKKVGY